MWPVCVPRCPSVTPDLHARARCVVVCWAGPAPKCSTKIDFQALTDALQKEVRMRAECVLLRGACRRCASARALGAVSLPRVAQLSRTFCPIEAPACVL